MSESWDQESWYRQSVYGPYLKEHPERNFAVFHLANALSFMHFVEPEFLIPREYATRSAGITRSLDALMTGAWEVLEPMYADGVGPALGAQTLAALGGNQHRAAANPRRTLRLVLTALDGFRGRDLPRHQGRGYLALGDTLRDNHDDREALAAYQRGRVLLEQAGDDHGLCGAYARLATLMGRLGLFEQELLYAEEGQRIGSRLAVEPQDAGHGLLIDTLHNQRVYALTAMGFTDEAEVALAAWRRERNNGSSFEYQRALGSLRLRQVRFAEGLDAYLRAIDTRYTNFDHPAPVRTFHLEHHLDVFSDAGGAALRLDRSDIAVAIFASIANRWSPVTAPVPSPAPLAKLDDEVRTLARQATSATVSSDREALAAYDDRARILLDTRSTLIREASPATAHRWTVTELVRAIPASVRPGELALLYMHIIDKGQELYRDGALLVFTIHGGTVGHRVVPLLVDEANALATRAHVECERFSGTENLDRLGEVLLAPVADLVTDASRVYVSAQGALEDFPFHAAAFRGEPLAVSTEVRALPAIVPLARDRRWTANGEPVRAVAAMAAKPRYELLPPLPALGAEAAAVRAAYPAAITLHDDAATAAAVREALSSSDVLHLAGHAVFEPSQPQLARILLADRPLFAFEVACAPRVPRMVNLSGCRTAAERRSLGGSEGLAAAFLAAGAETVIAPLWPVRDDAALAFNQALYAELAGPGADFARAARRAQLSLRADERFAHPGAWGAFRVLQRL